MVLILVKARFQSTLPRGERPIKCTKKYYFCNNFNPRSREGSDGAGVPSVHRHEISIHAPARGATPSSSCQSLTKEFQSTLPRGERRRIDMMYSIRLFISIHAPARGATASHPAQIFLLLLISIHAPARGATLRKDRYHESVCQFQSTLPRGERQDL